VALVTSDAQQTSPIETNALCAGRGSMDRQLPPGVACGPMGVCLRAIGMSWLGGDPGQEAERGQADFAMYG
jgi:hypothetical protein